MVGWDGGMVGGFVSGFWREVEWWWVVGGCGLYAVVVSVD